MMGTFTDRLNALFKIVKKSTYPRPHYNSSMSGPEWRNVEMAQELGNYLAAGNSLFSFPYFRQVGGMWKVFYQSYAAARKYDSARSIFTSEYMAMDIFVSIFSTLEWLLPKGILSLALNPFLPKKNNTEMQKHLADFYLKYAADLQTIPFYDQKYAEIRDDLAKKYKNCKKKTWTDWLSLRCTSAELTARYYISKPLYNWFHQEANLVTSETEFIVKFNAGIVDETAAKDKFKEQLNKLSQEAKATIVENHLYVKKDDNGELKTDKSGNTLVYALLSGSRYAAFQNTVKELSEHNIHLRKIAGQDQVQLKCIIDAEKLSLQNSKEALNNIDNVKVTGNYEDSIHPNRQTFFCDVPVKDLHKTIEKINAQKETQVEFIHNF